MANAKSINKVSVLGTNGKKIGTMNLLFPTTKVLSDFDELESTDDFGDPDTYNYGSDHEPDVLDVLIEMEENPPEYEQDEIAEVAAVNKYKDCTGFDDGEFDFLIPRLVYDPISRDFVKIFNKPVCDDYAGVAYDDLKEPQVRKATVKKPYKIFGIGSTGRMGSMGQN